MTSLATKVVEVIPAAGRTVHSLRDIGYELPQAVADLLDNSIEAEATEVYVDLVFDGADSWIRIADNGLGMDTATITESLRIGSVRDYADDDLGKFGFGLKTASISQCRRLVVASRIAPQRARIEARAFDLDHIERTNKWEILIIDPEDRPAALVEPLQDTTGTVVLWQALDRVLTYKDPSGQWAKKKMLEQADAVAQHLAMVFHRFLSGTARGRQRVDIFVNGAPVEPWDPFCTDEPATDTMEPSYYQVVSEGRQGIVSLHPYVLPGQAEFSDSAAWNRASGPNKWNNQQGLYIYRADRLIQWGGWNRLRTNDEHTKLARVSLDFSSDLDAAFGINISKAIVKLPPELRDEIQPVIRTVVSAAQARYRSNDKLSRPAPPRAAAASQARPTSTLSDGAPRATGNSYGLTRLGPSTPTNTPEPERPGMTVNASPTTARALLERAAAKAGEGDALERIVTSLKQLSPEVANELGW
ncbi:MAG: ATP-binding protein [Mycobacteriaceae bacterium]